MNNEPQPSDCGAPVDLLSRAFAALRAGAEGHEPAADALSAASDVAAYSAMQGARPFLSHARRARWIIGTLVGTGSIAASIAVSSLLFFGNGKSLALDDVVQKLRAAQRIYFVVEQQWQNPQRPPLKTRVWIMEPDKSRTSFQLPQGNIEMIRNGNDLLQLNPATKTAVKQTLPKGPVASERQALEDLRNAVEKDGHSLGDEMVDGVTAKKFAATINGREILLWADPATGNLLRLEYPFDHPEPEGRSVKIMSDFKLDEPFAADLFDVEPPEDYSIESFEPVPIEPAKNIAKLLQIYADKSAGSFPAQIVGADVNLPALAGLPENRRKMNAAELLLARQLDGLKVFLKSARQGEQFQYIPDVKLGEKDRLVFWCIDPPITGRFVPLVPRANAKEPEVPKPAAQTYLGVYGDLRIERVKYEDLPGRSEVPRPE